jgi:hypothetical protein
LARSEAGQRSRIAKRRGVSSPARGGYQTENTLQQPAKFRSVETWMKEHATWKMVGSETLTLLQDPDPVVLDGNALDEYAGSYEAGANMRFTFAREGTDLVASLNGGTKTAQKAQARDIFFTLGHGTTPKVFQRGDDGKITGFIYLRGKNSVVFKRVV